jgi:hypothetical protein
MSPNLHCPTVVEVPHSYGLQGVEQNDLENIIKQI